MKREAESLIGKTFNSLTLKRVTGKNKHNKLLGEFECVCGKIIERQISVVKGGCPKSCGCQLKGINQKHGMFGTPEYYSYRSMLQRCLNGNHPDYKYYGGKGVRICERWLGENGFINFYNDMGKRPEGKTLDKDILGNGLLYSPETCCWATHKEQTNNQTSNFKQGLEALKMLEEGMTLTRVAKHFNVAPFTIRKHTQNK